MDPIYLDHAAATPLNAEVAEVMHEAHSRGYGNPSSQHALGRVAKRLLEDSREQIVALSGGRSSGKNRDRLIFTSGATEANRTALLGLATGMCRVAVSPRDHPSIQSAAAELSSRGHPVRILPLGPRGTIAAESLAEEVDAAWGRSLILAATTVCGQTGLREDIEALAQTSGPVTIHADATQAAAWDSLAFETSPFATMTLAPHKFGGPRGIGGLLVRGDVAVSPLLPGSQELGLRGGTEAVALAVGFAKALELVAAGRAHESRACETLRDRFEAGIIQAARESGREAIIIGHSGSRAPHISAVSIRGFDRQTLVMAADLEGVCLSTGTACASGSSEPSPVLFALRLDDDVVAGTFRASLGRQITLQDVDLAVNKLARVLARLPR